MKKRILVLLAAAVLVLSMTACGGPATEDYAGFYSAAVPEGFVTDEWETEFTRDSEDYPTYEEIIKVYVSSGSAEEAITSSVEYWDGDHKRVDDVTHNGITWKVETFTWDEDAPSCLLYTDTEDGNYIEISIFMMAYDDEEIVAFLDSFSFEEGAYDKSYEWLPEGYGEE